MTPIDVALRTAVAGVLESQRLTLERARVRAIVVHAQLGPDGSPVLVHVRLDRLGATPARRVSRSRYLATSR